VAIATALPPLSLLGGVFVHAYLEALPRSLSSLASFLFVSVCCFW
jgi:hypothetical protein